jgi:hypothetical protein
MDAAMLNSQTPTILTTLRYRSNRCIMTLVSCCLQAKRVLYITLVRSKLLYCSPIWRPHLLRDIKALENVQRRATKFILNNYVSNYRLRLLDLHLCSFNLTNVLLLWLGLDTRCVGVVG